MTRPVGRPSKYQPYLDYLNPNELYTPSTIARCLQRLTDFQGSTPEQHHRLYQRIRIAMGRYANNHRFPDEGDGMLTIHGQAPCPAWFGWRWQEAVNEG